MNVTSDFDGGMSFPHYTGPRPPGRQITRAVRPPSARLCCSIHAMPGPPN